MAPGALAQVLRDLPKHKNNNIVVGFDTFDDACVYRLTDNLALIQTVDFFPPIVDDPFVFGQIAAANSLSDIYAMGGTPSHAMNLLCFPSCLELDVAERILAGGLDKATEAGCAIVGGHSINDNEPKYGLCVSGFANPKKILLNSTAREGDVLILTKALGTGILTTAFKLGHIDESALKPAIESMLQLNRYAAEAAKDFDIHSCTDITGFGLAGHVCEMAKAIGLTVKLNAAAIPVLPGVTDLVKEGIVTGGAGRNRDYFGHCADLGSISKELEEILYDPQTSGGLLFAVERPQAQELLERLQKLGITAAAVGTIEKFSGVYLR